MAKNSDRWFLVAWAIVALTFIVTRRYFIPDGVRHVEYILSHSTPRLGEARWLLFPTFLFGMLRPLHALGIIHSVEGALPFLGIASVAFSVLYLACLRLWLVNQKLPTSHRWVALTAAAVCPSFLTYATDTAEPLFAATFCVLGLATAARTNRLPFCVLLISAGLLLHQTVFVAFFFLPMAVGWSKLRDPGELRRTGAIIALVGLVIVVTLMIGNHISIGDAWTRIFLVYRNSIHMNWQRGGVLKGIVVTVLGGFPQALVSVPQMHGMRGIVGGLRRGDTQAFWMAFRLGLGFLGVACGVVYAWRGKRWDWLTALAGMSILPIIWNNVYGYQKFYMLFPVLVAHVIGRLSLRVSLPAIALLALLNITWAVSDLRDGRERYVARTAVYREADPGTHWVTSGWGPDFPYLWPGSDCAMLRSLARPSVANTVESLRAERTEEFMSCVRDAFCSGQPVWTDDLLTSNSVWLESIAVFHGLPTKFLREIWWRSPADGRVIDASVRHPLYTFDQGRRSGICQSLRKLNEDGIGNTQDVKTAR